MKERSSPWPPPSCPACAQSSERCHGLDLLRRKSRAPRASLAPLQDPHPLSSLCIQQSVQGHRPQRVRRPQVGAVERPPTNDGSKGGRSMALPSRAESILLCNSASSTASRRQHSTPGRSSSTRYGWRQPCTCSYIVRNEVFL